MKLWKTKDEWVGLAPCGDDIDFITEPEVLGPVRTAAVAEICAGCPVRPECIDWATVDRFVTDPKTKRRKRVGGQENSVWVAGQWIGDHYSAAHRREARALRASLHEDIPLEIAARPSEVL